MKSNNRSLMSDLWGKSLLTGFAAVLFTVALAVFLVPASADAATHHVGPEETYSTISAAVAVASDGDNIIVHDDTYTENVDVDKQLTIQSVNGYASTTLAAASSADHVFYVTADYVTITGFTTYGATEVAGDCAGIYLFSSEHCTISNNRCGYDNVHKNRYGICLSGSHNNSISGNTTNNNDVSGIKLAGGSGDNIISGNTANSNFCGITLTGSSSNNTIYLNNFSDNNSNVSSTEANTWHSPTTIYYSYASMHKDYLGNYYSGYTGSDDGTGGRTVGDGIGDTGIPYTTDGVGDNYPLMATSDHYSLQAWWLHSDDKMYRDDMTKPGGSVTISAGGSNIWIADQATLLDIDFSGTDTWTGQVAFTSAPASGHEFTVEIGYYDGSFHTGGPDATITGDGSATVFTYATDASTFTVTTGKYLALKITSADAEYSVRTGGAWSYCSASYGSPDYPLPVELSSFTATPGDGEVILHWVTESEIDNLGFHIYRALSEDGEYERLTSEVIEGAGTSTGKRTYRFVDGRLKNEVTYWYKLEDVGFDGRTALHGPISVTLKELEADAETVALPASFGLYQNAPNPFNPATVIRYDVPEACVVRLTVYDALGRAVAALVDGETKAGRHTAVWEAREASSGVYFVRMKAGDFVEVRKMVVMR